MTIQDENIQKTLKVKQTQLSQSLLTISGGRRRRIGHKD